MNLKELPERIIGEFKSIIDLSIARKYWQGITNSVASLISWAMLTHVLCRSLFSGSSQSAYDFQSCCGSRMLTFMVIAVINPRGSEQLCKFHVW